MRKLVSPPNAEVLGENIRAFTDNMMGRDTTPIIEKYGLAKADRERWYPLHWLLDALNEIAETQDTTSAMVAIGMEIARILPLPPHMENPTLEEVLLFWNDAYQYLHRKGDVGHIRIEKLTETHFKTTHTDLYPDDLTYGLAYGYARRFLPPGTAFTVYYDPDVPPRDAGGQDKTVLHIKW